MITENNTGFYRVSKIKNKNMKKGYRFKYSMKTQLLTVDIRCKDLYELKIRVEKNNLLWGIINKEKALETCIDEKIPPFALNSSCIDDTYLNHVFNSEDDSIYREGLK